jgi:hypothetical protein
MEVRNEQKEKFNNGDFTIGRSFFPFFESGATGNSQRAF